MPRGGVSTQVMTGAVIEILGILLLLSTTGVYDVGSVWRYVPSLFILLGVWALSRSDFRNVRGPVILILIADTVQLLTLVREHKLNGVRASPTRICGDD